MLSLWKLFLFCSFRSGCDSRTETTEWNIQIFSRSVSLSYSMKLCFFMIVAFYYVQGLHHLCLKIRVGMGLAFMRIFSQWLRYTLKYKNIQKNHKYIDSDSNWIPTNEQCSKSIFLGKFVITIIRTNVFGVFLSCHGRIIIDVWCGLDVAGFPLFMKWVQGNSC